MSLTLEKIFEAKNRIAPYTTRTPLIRLEKAGRVPWLSGVSEGGVHADHRRI